MNSETEQTAGGAPVEQGAGGTPEALAERITRLLDTILTRVERLEAWKAAADQILTESLPAVAASIHELEETQAGTLGAMKQMALAQNADHSALLKIVGVKRQRVEPAKPGGVN